MRLGPVAVLASVVLFAGCHPFDPKHPLVGNPRLPRRATEPAYWIWFADGAWQLRMIAGLGTTHRFQGSLAGVNGAVAELSPVEPQLREQIALVNQAVQFDVESGDGAVSGFGA